MFGLAIAFKDYITKLNEKLKIIIQVIKLNLHISYVF